MAQLVLPFILLGSAYIISNMNDNEKENDKEGMSNQYTTVDSSNTCTTDIDRELLLFKTQYINWDMDGHEDKKDYELFLKKLFKKTENKNCNTHIGEPNPTNIQGEEDYKEFKNPNLSQNRFFNKGGYSQDTTTSQDYVSLTGETIENNKVTHNNMQPYFSSKLTGSVSGNDQANATLLDQYSGAGSLQIEKKENGSFFKPESNVQNVYGVQNTNDFYQSRVVPSQKIANIKPWKEEQVGPGLNQGYNATGSGGFNSGMDAREHWGPKTVNELRTQNNQKTSYTLDNHQGPAMNPIKELGKMGKIDKNSVDTYYVNNPNRWFTTTGEHKGKTSRSQHLMPESNRNDTTVEYFGARGRDDGHGGGTGYVTGEHEVSNKTTLPSNPFINLMASGTADPNTADYGTKSFKLLKNNRTTTRSSNVGNAHGVNGVLNSIVKPIIDTLRHTRKTNVVGNIRETGNMGVKTKAPMIYNTPNMPVTNRQMTENKLNCTHLNYQGQIEGGYMTNKHQQIENQRETTNRENMGNVGGTTKVGLKTYDAVYSQRNNDKRTQESRTNMGGMGLFNPYENVNLKTEKPSNNRTYTMDRGSHNMPATEFMGTFSKTPQSYDEVTNTRNDAHILDAFKNNPYTQPLGSVA